jgi:hypothetical protein
MATTMIVETPPAVKPLDTSRRLTRAELRAVPDPRAFALWLADRALETVVDAPTWDKLRAILGRAMRRRPNWVTLHSDARWVAIPQPAPRGTAPADLHLACFYAQYTVAYAVYETCDDQALECVCDYAACLAGCFGETDTARKQAMGVEWDAQRAEWARRMVEASQEGRAA